MSVMVSFVLSFFPRDVLDEILNLIESVSEDFPSYSSIHCLVDREFSSCQVAEPSFELKPSHWLGAYRTNAL